ncbi:MAG TPA: hypothetical protein VGS20_05295 [Candidatus Acidoferrales bacterium]|nr:hypothetical protein [Candidatus Acidoferrales bacterium]
MRAILTWVLALGLAGGTAAFADTDKTKSGASGETAKSGTAKATAAAPAASAGSSAAAKTPEPPSALAAEVQRLQVMIEAQAKQLDAQQKAIEAQQQKIAALEMQITQTPAANATGASSLRAVAPATATNATQQADLAAAAPSTSSLMPPVARLQEGQREEASPLQVRVGSAYITPVGFMDFTGIWRSRDGGSGIGTNFGGIPYGSTFQRNLSEFRLSMQNSRIGFRVDARVKGAHVIGYMESDFLGNNPGNVAVSSNSNTQRSRLYWVDLRKGQWEVLGGQTWSLITPGRTGISALPGDLFFTQNIDVNYQLGLVWGRIPEFRFVYHPSAKAALAFALDSPEQYIGGSAGGGTPTLPSALSATFVNGELNAGNSTLGVPNRAPDFIAKLALDPSSKLHFEAGGVVREFQLFNPLTATHSSTTGGGGFVNLNFELFKGFRVLTNNFWSDGGGRYIFGQAPDLIVRANGRPSLVHSGSTVTGIEYTRGNTLLYGYYGGVYVSRNVTLDANGKPIGYGFVGSPNGQNRNIQEGTIGFNQTFWKDAKYGALNFMGQYSYLTRDPWSIAAGQPNNAHMSMVFLNLRYTLPGSAPAMK